MRQDLHNFAVLTVFLEKSYFESAGIDQAMWRFLRKGARYRSVFGNLLIDVIILNISFAGKK